MYNGDIRVINDAGKNKLLVNEVHQSSGYIYKFWNHAVHTLLIARNVQNKKILILGVAGGTVIHILSRLFPKAQMIGVDIDSVMIEIGKRYFGLSGIPHLSLVTADANAYIHKSQKKFDLIIVDVYVARDLPDFLRERKFLRAIRTRLASGGYVLINYLRDGEYGEKVKELEKNLTHVFDEVHYTNYLNNRFFLARK